MRNVCSRVVPFWGSGRGSMSRNICRFFPCSVSWGFLRRPSIARSFRLKARTSHLLGAGFSIATELGRVARIEPFRIPRPFDNQPTQKSCRLSRDDGKREDHRQRKPSPWMEQQGKHCQSDARRVIRVNQVDDAERCHCNHNGHNSSVGKEAEQSPPVAPISEPATRAYGWTTGTSGRASRIVSAAPKGIHAPMYGATFRET